MDDGTGRRELASLVTPPEHAPGDAPAILGDRYRVLDTLGRGGAATVYRAHDLMLGREVAVKVLAPVEPACDEVLRHEAEMRVLSSVRHPGLVTLFDAGTDPVDGGALVRAYLVMELVAGPTLAHRLHAGALAERSTARVGWALAGALATVHARGVVHRDVKPSNVLLTAADALDGDPDVDDLPESAPVKLADFGIARIAAATRLTITGAVVGTAAYLSPEQATGSALGPATDVYTLGLVLLECLTGTPAFVGTVAEVAAARLFRDPEVPAHLDPAFAGLLRRMTDRDAAARPTAAQVCDELAAFLGRQPEDRTVTLPLVPAAAPVEGGGVAIGFSEPVRPHGARRRSRRPARPATRRRAGAVALVAALVLAAAITTTATTWRSHAQASAEQTAQAWTDGLQEDAGALTAAIREGRLDAADTLLLHAQRELTAARRSGALPEARLTAFAATFDGAAQQLASARALAAQEAAAAAAAAQAQLAATTSDPASSSAAPSVAPKAPAAAPPAGPGTSNGKGDHGPGRTKGKRSG
jgi:eukaryotic-like serine/threonine-protein kinase